MNNSQPVQLSSVWRLKWIATWGMIGWLVDWLVRLFSGVSTLFGSFNAELGFSDKSFKQFNSNVKIFLFQTILFSKSSQFNSIWPIERTQSSATTPGHSGLGSIENKGVLGIPQSSPSDCLVSYLGHSLGWGGALTS